MMKQQSPEFLLGYLFSEIERKIIKDMISRGPVYGHCPSDTYTAKIPLLWFGVKYRNCTQSIRANVTTLAEELCEKLDETLVDIFTNRLFHTTVSIDKQYVVFLTTSMVEDRHKLTVSQIENLLGYKIAIIPETL